MRMFRQLSIGFILLFTIAISNAQPNVIFIMADDLGYGDLGCYGQTEIKTPNIDALASGGMRFTQAYAGGPVCTSSRSVLMTGLHNGHTVARDNVPHYDTYLKNGDVTVAEVLKETGYQCGGIGKWSLGDPGTEGDATKQGFDMWFGYQTRIMPIITFRSIWTTVRLTADASSIRAIVERSSCTVTMR